MAGSITIAGLLTGISSGTQYVGPFTLPANALGNYFSTEITPAGTGVFTIVIFSWVETLIVVPPIANAIALSFLGGAPGNTGYNISPNTPSLFSFPATAQQDIYFQAASAFSAPITYIYT
jgi:hypothetical protein